MNRHWSTAVVREMACIAAYAVLAFAATYPLVLHLSTGVPTGGDAWSSYWNLWWVKRALFELQTNPYYTSEVHAPYGANLYFHTLNLLPSALLIPISATLGLAAAYNTLIFASFALSGYGTYRLVLYVIRRSQRGLARGLSDRTIRASGFIGGTVFSFSSYHYVHVLGHLDLASIQWLPFYVLFVLKTCDERGWRAPVVAGLLLAATGLTAAYHMFFLILWTGVLALYLMISAREWWAPLRRLAGALVVFALATSPVLVPMLLRADREGRIADPAYDANRFSTDLAAFVIPSPLSLFGRTIASEANRKMMRPESNNEMITFLGFTALALAVIGQRTDLFWRRFWLLSFAVFAALALGPRLHFMGRDVLPEIGPVMPYRLLSALPFSDTMRVPSRYVVMALLSLAVLAACGAVVVLSRCGRAAALIATAAALVAVVVAEHAVVPLRISFVNTPQYFTRLAQQPSDETMLQVPIPDDQAVYPMRMRDQTVHGRRMFGGYLSRSQPPLPFAAIPGFAQLKNLSDTIDDVIAYEAATLPALSRAVLRAYSTGPIVIEGNRLTNTDAARAQTVAETLLGRDAKEYEDVQMLAYRVPPLNAVPFGVWLDTGWSYLERDENNELDGRSVRWRWMAERARVGLIAPASARIALGFTARAFAKTRRLRVSLQGQEVAMIEIGTERDRYQLAELHVPAGVHFLELESLDSADSPGTDRRLLSVALFRLEFKLLSFADAR